MYFYRITKQITWFIPHWNSIWLRGSVGKAHIYVESNKEIVGSKPKVDIFLLYVVLFGVCVLGFQSTHVIFKYV